MSSRQLATQGIILTRANYHEADRIITFLTPDNGKVTAIAKSVRKASAKLAGATELFSISDITLVDGRGDISTLISARLQKHYSNITKDIDRTTFAYEFLRLVNKATEDKAEEGYFDLLKSALAAIDNDKISPALADLWFKMQLLKVAGHTPNLRTDSSGQELKLADKYSFNYEKMHFNADKDGAFSSGHIKFLRLGFGSHQPTTLTRIEGVKTITSACQPLVDTILRTYIHL